MKGLFILLCMLCAVLSSALIFVLGTQKESDPAAPKTPPPSFPPVSVSVYPEQTRALEDLTSAIIAREEALEKKDASLRKLEADLHLRTALITRLQAELNESKQTIDQHTSVLSEDHRKNSRKLAEFYARMDPENTARLLMEMDPHRVALILTFLSDRQAGAIMDAAVAMGDDGIQRAVAWSEIIREMKNP